MAAPGEETGPRQEAIKTPSLFCYSMEILRFLLILCGISTLKEKRKHCDHFKEPDKGDGPLERRKGYCDWHIHICSRGDVIPCANVSLKCGGHDEEMGNILP